MQEGILNFRNLAIGPHRCNPKLKIKVVFVLASNRFRKCFSVNAGVWLRMENKFSGNYFQLTGCFEGFDPEMVWSENFHFKPFPDSRAKTERERERERERAFDFGFADHSLRLRLWLRRLRRSQPSNSTSPIYEPTNLRTDHAFDFADHAFNFVDLRTHEPIFGPEPSTHEPSTSPATQSLRATNRSSTLRLRPRAMNPQTDLSLCVILIDPQTHEPLISDFFVVVVVVWVVVENSIFRMLPNTWKYFLEQFS